MSAILEIQLIAILISIACSLTGSFLVLKKMAMITDAISHTVLLGIVIAFLFVRDLNSPVLIIGATLVGIFTVWISEIIAKSDLINTDSAIGLVFPLLFSIAIILIALKTRSVHLDTHTVILGELAFAPFDRMVVFGVDIGAKSLYTSASLLIANLIFVTLFFKELKVVTFDPILAITMGFSPTIIYYLLMSMVSVTVVGAFDSVGSVLVIAFMIVPANTAYILTDNLKHMLILSSIFATISSIVGFQFAYAFDVSIAGSMAVVTGLLFALAFVFSPKSGLISLHFIKKKQQHDFAQLTVLVHIKNHQHKAEALEENSIKTLHHHLYWDKRKTLHIVNALLKSQQVEIKDDILYLTHEGSVATDLGMQKFLRVHQ